MADNVAIQEEGSSASVPRLHVKATAEQTYLLQAAFLTNAHPMAETRQRLAELTGLSVRWITAWFSRKRRSSGLGATPPAVHRTDSSRSVRGPLRGQSSHERLAVETHSQRARFDTPAPSPAFGHPPAGWPGPQLTGLGIPSVPTPHAESYPPMHYMYPDNEAEIFTPSLASAFSATSSPFPLTPFSLDMVDLPVKKASDLEKTTKEGALYSQDCTSSFDLSSVSGIDLAGISPTTFIDWELILSGADSPASPHHLGSTTGFTSGSTYTPVIALQDMPMPNTWPPQTVDTLPSSSSRRMTGPPALPAAALISYSVRLSDVKAAHRLAYTNHLNAQGAVNGPKPPPSNADPLLSQVSLSSPPPAPMATFTPIKRPASSSSPRSSSQKKHRLSTDDKENWPPSSPLPVTV